MYTTIHCYLLISFFKTVCTVNGARGDGTTAGTCIGSEMKCQPDGTCKFCGLTGQVNGIYPGCNALNPICVGGTSCHCNTAGSLTCDSKHSICDSGECKCGTSADGGTGSACVAGTAKPYCNKMENAAANTATCGAGNIEV